MGKADAKHKRAIQLGAPDADEFISKIPGLRALLSPRDIAQIQRVIDAATVNPKVKEEIEEAYRKSIVAQSGNLVVRDPNKERKAKSLSDNYIQTDDRERRIRLNYTKMLSTDALVPRTDNPDEADYLSKVRLTLQQKGVWLRIGQPFVRDKNNPSRHGLDPRVWELWFSLGPDGDTIPSNDAVLDREELLGTTMLGAGYYRAVHTGTVQTKLKRLYNRINTEFDAGWDEHVRLQNRRRDAAIGVAEISDTVGGATLPSIAIWEKPQKFILAGIRANVSGDVMAAQANLIIAAAFVEKNAKSLAEYAQKSGEGAAMIVRILEIVKVVGAVAGTAAIILGGAGLGLKLLRSGGQTTATGLAEYQALSAAEKRMIAEYIESVGETTVQVVKTPGGGATKLGSGIKHGQSAGHGTGRP